VSDTAPTGVPDNSLWWESDSGLLYVRYNDGDSSQWVVAVPTPTLGAFLLKSGDTMTGPLALAADPTTALQAATKQYVDHTPALNNVGRNLLHNPLFNVAQRGAGAWTTNAAYTADRWQAYLNLDTVNVTLGPFNDTQRAAIGDEAATTALIYAVAGNAGAASYSFISQKIEGLRRLSGKTVTVSLWAYATAGTPKIGIGFQQLPGTGGSPSGGSAVNATPITLTTTPTRYSATFTLPSAAGLTLGTNGDDATWLKIFFSSGATANASAGGIGVQNNTFVLWGVQLEVGSVATPLEKPDPQQDLAKCQRFYCTGGFYVGGYGTAGMAVQTTVSLPVTMRGAMTMTPSFSIQTNCGSSSMTALSQKDWYAQTTVTATGGYALAANYTVSADL
jgi:hypothetical protein